jgi:hypothetical protein
MGVNTMQISLATNWICYVCHRENTVSDLFCTKRGCGHQRWAQVGFNAVEAEGLLAAIYDPDREPVAEVYP